MTDETLPLSATSADAPSNTVPDADETAPESPSQAPEVVAAAAAPVVATAETVWDVLIAGGGMAGLLTAARLASQHPGIRVALLEREPVLGGRLRTSLPADRISGYGLGGISAELFNVWQQTLNGLATPEAPSVTLPSSQQGQLGVLTGGKIAAQPIEQWFTPKGAKTLGGMTAARQWAEVTDSLRQGATGGTPKVVPEKPAREGASARAQTTTEASEGGSDAAATDEESSEDPAVAGRAHAFSHYWKQTRKTPAAIVLEHFANAFGIPDVWGATPEAISERAAFHAGKLHMADWHAAVEALRTLPAFAAAVHLETGNRIVDARRENDLWIVDAEKGRYQARALVVAQTPWQATAWLRRTLWPAALLQVASKTKPVSMVVLTERLLTEAARAEVPDVVLVPAERVQSVRTGRDEICFQATIDFELSLQAPAVIKAVKSLKRARKKLQQVYEGGVSESGHITLLPVAWAQSPLHADRRWLERLDKKTPNTPTLAFCGDAYGASYDGDSNLIRSVSAACSAISPPEKQT